MNPTSISALLQRFESELQTADGRTVNICRDANGNYWVIDDAERITSLSEFASDCTSTARQSCEHERAQAMREIAASVKRAVARAVARAVMALRSSAQPAHA